MPRDHMNAEERAAMEILDAVRAGLYVTDAEIARALWVTGDLVGCKG